ncbi:MAG: MFS transporter [Pseudomonadota bacterium]
MQLFVSAASAEGSANPELPALSQNRVARFAAILLLYFMQGVPVGLSLIAIPAWLAANGATPVIVGAFVATALLPWSMKLINGLLMDRFTYKPMGRRRSWILLAQINMVITLIMLAIIAPGAEDIATLTAFFFVLNLCAVFNDVAVDGMTVDLVPHKERTTINGLMFASQAVGISVTSYLGGQFLAIGQLSELGMILACGIGLASLFVSIFRERPGERLLPWSAGQASPECEARQQRAWWPLLKGMFGALAAPLTLLFLLGGGLSQAAWAFLDAVAPTLSVQVLGWSSEQYSSYASIISLSAALFAAFATPILVKLLGLRRVVITLFITSAAIFTIAGVTFDPNAGGRAFAVVFALQYILSLLLLITMIVWAMRICNPAIAASLFALFMAVPNFSRGLMSGLSGLAVDSVGYGGFYLIVAAVIMVGLLFCLLGRVGDERIAARLQSNPNA